jgi:hypothetical protein
MMRVYGSRTDGSRTGAQGSGAPEVRREEAPEVRREGVTVHSRHDHRIAMACAVAALRAAGPVTIEEAEAINKSYPDFYGHIQHLGASVMVDGKQLGGQVNIKS